MEAMEESRDMGVTKRDVEALDASRSRSLMRSMVCSVWGETLVVGWLGGDATRAAVRVAASTGGWIRSERASEEQGGLLSIH